MFRFDKIDKIQLFDWLILSNYKNTVCFRPTSTYCTKTDINTVDMFTNTTLNKKSTKNLDPNITS